MRIRIAFAGYTSGTQGMAFSQAPDQLRRQLQVQAGGAKCGFAPLALGAARATHASRPVRRTVLIVALGLGIACANGCARDIHDGEDISHAAADEALSAFDRGTSLYLALPPMADVPRELAAKALAEFEQAHQVSEGISPHYLPAVIWAAYDAGRFEKAHSYAIEALSFAMTPWMGNDHRYAAHLVLGHIALDAGDDEWAARHLAAAGRQTDKLLFSWGPNVSLARQLLKHDQRDVVAEYFEQWASVSSLYRRPLNDWAAQVRAGHIPNIPKPSSFLKRIFIVPTPP